MRIQGVTGDLPAVAQLMNEGAAKVDPPAVSAAPPPAVAAAASAGDASGGQADAERRRPPKPLASFDPPLIAQRAVLGWPVGPLVAEHARQTGVSYGAVWAQVDSALAAVAAEEPADA